MLAQAWTAIAGEPSATAAGELLFVSLPAAELASGEKEAMRGRMVLAAPPGGKTHVGGRSRRNTSFMSGKQLLSPVLHRGCNRVGYDFALRNFDPKIDFIEIGKPGSAADPATVARVQAAADKATKDTAKPKPKTPPLVKRNVWGTYVDEQVSYTTKPPRKSAARIYTHENHLYSVAATTNPSSQVVERYSYNAYGVRTVKNSAGATLAKSAVGQDRGFTSYKLDSETGLADGRSRMYSPKLGRYINWNPWSQNEYEITSGYSARNIDDMVWRLISNGMAVPNSGYYLQGKLNLYTAFGDGVGNKLEPYSPPFLLLLLVLGGEVGGEVGVVAVVTELAVSGAVVSGEVAVGTTGVTAAAATTAAAVTTGTTVTTAAVIAGVGVTVGLGGDSGPGDSCPSKKCLDCIPLKGTLGSQIALPNSRFRGRHSQPGNTNGHVKYFQVNQTSYPECKCKWNYSGITDENTQIPRVGSVPYPGTRDAGGGGPAP